MTPERTFKKDQFQSLLRSCGLTIPASPHYQELPLPLLLRGDNSHARITGKEPYFIPNPGQMGSWGIFFADVLSALMDADILYVFQEQEVLRATGAAQWLSYDGENSQDLFMRVASEKNLDISTISGGVAAETKLFQTYPIYQPATGIATIPTPLPVAAASHIFVNKRVLENMQNRIPDALAEKIVEF